MTKQHKERQPIHDTELLIHPMVLGKGIDTPLYGILFDSISVSLEASTVVGFHVVTFTFGGLECYHFSDSLL